MLDQLRVRQADLLTKCKRQGRESGKITLDLRLEHVKQAPCLVASKKINPQVFIACVRATRFFVVREEFQAPGCQKLFSGGCAIGVNFGFRQIHVQTPVAGWSIEVVETVLDVEDVLTFDQDVVDVSVVASAGFCPGEGAQWQKNGGRGS